MDTMHKMLASCRRFIVGRPARPHRIEGRPAPAQTLAGHYARVMKDDAHFRASEAARFVA